MTGDRSHAYEAIVRRPYAGHPVYAALVRREPGEEEPCRLLVLDPGARAHLRDGRRLAGEGLDEPRLEREHGGRGLLPGLHAGLVVRVDADARGVQPHGALVERDQ